MKNFDSQKIAFLAKSIVKLKKLRSQKEKFEAIIAELFNQPYVADSLVGSSTCQEELTINFDGFDCVTFVETVITLLNSDSAESFAQNLCKIRYQNGEVDWLTRNHYFSDWMSRNLDLGLIKEPSIKLEEIKIEKELSCLKDYPNQTCALSLTSTKSLPLLKECVEDVFLIAFATTRDGLDYSHVGFMTVEDDKLMLTHASRSLGVVSMEPIDSFLERYGECPGISLYKL